MGDGDEGMTAFLEIGAQADTQEELTEIIEDTNELEMAIDSLSQED